MLIFTGALWSETQSVIVTNGLFNVILGSINPIDVDDLGGTRYLGITVGTDPEISPRSKLIPVPISEKAKNSDLLDNNSPSYYLDWANITNMPAGFADGVDDNTTFTTGDGISISGGTHIYIPSASITSTMIQNSTITGSDIATSSIEGIDIKDGTITSADIANATVTSTDIADATITGADIASGSITGADIQSNSVSNTDLSNESWYRI